MVRTNEYLSLQYISFFLWRRVLIGTVLVHLLEYPAIVIVIKFIASSWVLSFVFYVKPFDNKIANALEIFNEIMYLMQLYCLLGFTDFLAEKKYI